MTVITIGDNEWGGNALRNTWGAAPEHQMLQQSLQGALRSPQGKQTDKVFLK